MSTDDIPAAIDTESFEKGGPNTRLEYFYRDADNYKQHASVVLPGALTIEQAIAIMNNLDDDDGFVPSAVGLSDLQEQMINGWDDSVDHPYHELGLIALTDWPTTDQMTAADFATRFAAADWENEGARVSSEHS